MPLLDLIHTIGRAKSGSRAIVAEQFDAINSREGGRITLPIGTPMEITCTNGPSLSAIAEIGDRLCSVYILVEQYPMIALKD